MQVFRVYLRILWKRKNSLLIYTGIFLAISLGLTFFGSEEAETGFEAEKYPIVIFDQDGSKASEKFANYLESKNKVVEYPDHKEELTDHLFARNIACVIYIKSGFEKELEQGNVEQLIEVTTLPGTVYSQSILNYVDQYLGAVHAYQKAGMSMDEAMEHTEKLQELKPKVQIGKQGDANEKSTIYYFMLYLPYVVVSCSILGISSCIVIFNKKEVRDRMNVSAYPLLQRNVGLWGGSVVVQTGYALLFLVLSCFIYQNGAFSQTRGLMALNFLCFSVLSLSLSFLIGMLVTKEQVLDMASTVIGLAMSFLGGIFVPLSLMGEGIKLFSHFIPTYWYVTALDIVERGTYHNNGQYWFCLAIQLGFAVAFLALGMTVSKMRRKTA